MEDFPSQCRVKTIPPCSLKKLNVTFHTIQNPSGRFNVALGTKVLLLSERDEQLHLDPVIWGYAPGGWDKPPLINVRSETAATSRMFKTLRQHGLAICFADSWYEWKKEGMFVDNKSANL